MSRAFQPEPLEGFTKLLSFMVRRDRVRATVWFLGVVGVFTLSAASVTGLYRSPGQLATYARFAQADVAVKAITGPGYGLDHPTQGAVVMNETGLYTLIAVALMCVFLIIRHTRAEEETDRAELVRAAPVGRLATLAAALVWVSCVNLVVALGVTLGLVALGLPAAGSVAFGAAVGGTGLVFTALAAGSAQLAATAHAASAGAAGALGVFFVVRGVGDMGHGWMSWLSPLGWAQAIRPYDHERWWVLVPLVVVAATLAFAAVQLQARRDLGAGFLRQRPGPARAGPRLASPLAMSLRLQRGSLTGWVVGVSLTGFFFGIVADQADELLKNQAVAKVFATSASGTPTELFLATIVLMLALITGGFAVSSVLRIRKEELSLMADTTLAAPVSRRRWLLSHLGVAVGGSVVIMVIAGLLTGAGYAAEVGAADEVFRVVGASLAMVPALVVLSTLAVALVGMWPRWSPVAWIGVVVAVVVGLLGETLRLPHWIRDFSPFQHVPAMPAEPFRFLPPVALLAVAGALTIVGVLGIERRDIARH